MSHTRRRLKNYIVNPQFQFAFVAYCIFSSLLAMVVFGSLFYHYYNENYRIFLELSPMTDETKKLMRIELRNLSLKMFAVAVCHLIATAIFGLVISHRAAGPIYHFTRVFEAIKNGNSGERIRLRPADNFQEAAVVFNSMMDSLEHEKVNKPPRAG